MLGNKGGSLSAFAWIRWIVLWVCVDGVDR